MKTSYSGFSAIIVIPLIFVVTTTVASPAFAAGKDESLRRGETRATLDPNQFPDSQVRKVYRIAKEIPWVLDSIFCYCYCESSIGHKSLLSCYVDNHAAM